jgi:hypothetical protein
VRSVRTVLAVVMVASATAWGADTAAAAAPYCGITWGSAMKRAPATDVAPLAGVRGGRHGCYDRLVLDMRAPGADGYRVRYVKKVLADASGTVVPLRGGAELEIIAQAPAYDENGQATFVPGNESELVDVTGWRTFRQVAWAGSSEGQSTVGLGVRAKLPFRVFTLSGGQRLVIDVAHRW